MSSYDAYVLFYMILNVQVRVYVLDGVMIIYVPGAIFESSTSYIY